MTNRVYVTVSCEWIEDEHIQDNLEPWGVGARCPHCHRQYKFDWVAPTPTGKLYCPSCHNDSLVGLAIRSMDS